MTLDHALRIVTDLGDSAITGSLAVIFAGYLLCYKQNRFALAVMAAFLGTAAVIALCKIFLYSQCSDFSTILNLHSPSGHTALSLTVYGTMAIIIASSLSGKKRILPYLIAIPLIGTIAYSRIHMKVHTISDVVIGITIGLLTTFTVWRTLLKGQRVHCHWWVFLILTLGTVAALYGFHFPAEDLIRWISQNLKAKLRVC